MLITGETATDMCEISLNFHKITLQDPHYFHFAAEDTKMKVENLAPGHNS